MGHVAGLMAFLWRWTSRAEVTAGPDECDSISESRLGNDSPAPDSLAQGHTGTGRFRSERAAQTSSTPRLN